MSHDSHGHAPHTTAAAHAGHASGHGGVGHVVPVWFLATILVILLILTWLTVEAVRWQFGSLNIWIAMIIATVKAALVALYFMHLRYDRPFNGVIFLCSLVFVLLFVGIALMDTAKYKPDIQWKQVTLQRQ